MITYWFASRSAHFHPSIFAVAGSPNGRELSPHGLPVKLLGRAAKARSAYSLPFFLIMVFGGVISFSLLLAHRVQSDVSLIIGLFSPLVVLGTLGQIDRVFWMVCRAHDIGKSWLWVGIPVLLFALTPAFVGIGLYLFGPGVAAAIALGCMMFVVMPSGLTLFWIYGAESQQGENRYGPPAKPILEYWYD